MRPATIVDTNVAPPQLASTWIVRGASFVVAITRAKRGARLTRKAQVDESMLFVPPGATAEVAANGERLTVAPDSLVILPQGDSEIVALDDGDLFRIFTSRARDVAAQSANAATYPEPIAQPADWPAPTNGYRLRVYPLANVVSGEAFGRIYRSTNLMVNIFEPFAAARDQTALSPHSHDDFEQATITITGSFDHYLRTPWGKTRAAWRPDLVATCESPSITIIPVGMIHTTAWLAAQGRMIDVFSPPRVDFSKQAGWVRNASDYPAPETVQ